jgi:hypothetical protein
MSEIPGVAEHCLATLGALITQNKKNSAAVRKNEGAVLVTKLLGNHAKNRRVCLEGMRCLKVMVNSNETARKLVLAEAQPIIDAMMKEFSSKDKDAEMLNLGLAIRDKLNKAEKTVGKSGGGRKERRTSISIFGGPPGTPSTPGPPGSPANKAEDDAFKMMDEEMMSSHMFDVKTVSALCAPAAS